MSTRPRFRLFVWLAPAVFVLLAGPMFVMIGMRGFADSPPSSLIFMAGAGVSAVGLVLLGMAMK
jgi:hypothetical protein